jgi:2-dehydro-3-deoxyphosphooctonate aldolase (KDO 8-P synthase)
MKRRGKTGASVRLEDGTEIGGEKPVIIMGPCVIEGRDHTLKMAKALKKAADAVGLPMVFKSSFDKANRTSFGSFRGPGLDEGLAILAEVKDRLGLPVTTDIHETIQVEQAAGVVDILQVPAFLCRQTDLIVACAQTGRPTSVKKGQFLSPRDCGNIVSKYQDAGGQGLMLMERGSSFGYNTLVVDFRGLPIMRSFGVPVIFDATHSVQSPGGQGGKSGGDSKYVPALVRAALAVGVEGIFLEVHEDPTAAKSDGPNVVPLKHLPWLLEQIATIHAAIGRPSTKVPWE